MYHNILLIIPIILIIPILWLWLHKKRWIIEHKKWADYYKRIPVPNAQWIRLWITLLCVIITLGYQYITNPYVLMYIWAGTILAIMATIDLFKPIPSYIRLIIQLALFTSIVIYGWVSIDSIRMWVGNHDVHIFPRIWIVWSIIWFILCTNAINWFDGIQWQSSWVTTVGAFSLRAVVAFIVLPNYENLTPDILNQLEITKIIAFSLWLVSLIYTIIEYKPLWLIRDIGTTIYWFSLAYLALLWWAKIWTLVVTLSLVIFDMAWVIIHRILVLKKNPMKWDYTHLHHRLIANWRNRSEIRWFVWIRSIVMTVLMIVQWTNSINKRIILSMMALLFFGINIYLFWIKKLPTEMKVNFTTSEVEDLKMEL